jgi:methyl-accepting chemotaxis protein
MTIVEELRTTHRSAPPTSRPTRKQTPTRRAETSSNGPDRARRFGNVSVMGKLLAGFGVVALITLMVGVVGIRAQVELNNSAQRLKKDGLDATTNLMEYLKHTMLSDRQMNQFVVTSDKAKQKAALASIADNDKEADEHYGIVTSQFAFSDDSLAKIKSIHTTLLEARSVRDQTLVPAVKVDNDSVVQTTTATIAAKTESALVLFEEVIAASDLENSKLSKAISKTASEGKRTTVALLAIGVLAALGLGVGIARLVARPAQDVESILQQVAAGDLRIRSSSGGGDEMGRMSRSLNESLQRTQDVVSTIGASAASLTEASNSLATNASQVAANVQTAAAGTEEMTASIQEIARNAQEASRVADEAVRLAIESSQMVADLDAASSEIGHVVEMITSIAEQTNLLALNATIEAARAGDAGRGFAVVANEVKELAQNTSTATQSIRSMVDQIQSKSGQARSGIEQITEVIQQINESQITIAGAVEEQTVTTSEMARQLNEAAYGALAISGGVEGDGVGSATDISRMAGELQAAVDQFQF